MKYGDIVAFGKNNKVDLLCRVEGGNISNIRMLVLNGRWELEYLPLENAITYTPPNRGRVVVNHEIIYNGYLPSGNYNYQIDFIENLLSKPVVMRCIYIKFLNAKDGVICLKKRIAKSCKAFYNCWNDVDDSITF